MPELIRSVVTRARVFFHDRRQTPRLQVRLIFTVSIPHPTNGNGSHKPTHFLNGHTRDISAKGLALLVPQVHLNGRHFAAEGCGLELRLQMGSDTAVQMLVMPERYERLDEAELGCSYLIGARIVKIDEETRHRYLNYISEGLARDAA
ncbi:MAG: PilZ domain-containing protein [Pyrinomonadaceae bacterium]